MDSINYMKSFENLELTQHINQIISIIIVIIGLLGNFLTILVFVQPRFRRNSTNVYLLFMAINNSIYLIVHLVYDLTLVNNHLINYLKYVLRFNSAYTMIVFILQRVLIVYKPMLVKFRKRTSAWLTILVIVLISLILNAWILFDSEYYDILTFICSILIILILPTFIILLSNCFLIFSLFKDRKNRLSRRIINRLNRHEQSRIVKLRPVYLNLNQYLIRTRIKEDNKIKKNIILIVASFILYMLMNLPYLIVWFLINENNDFFYYSMLKISEIIYCMNFSLNFYLYCVPCSVFRKRLKYSCKYIMIIIIIIIHLF